MPRLPPEEVLRRQIRSRTHVLAPRLARAVLAGFDAVRDSLSAAEVERLLRLSRSEAFIATLFSNDELDLALLPVRRAVQGAVRDATVGFIRTIPGAGSLVTGFDDLDPNILRAVHELNTKVMTSLRGDVRDTFRAIVRQGIEESRTPAWIARRARETIGLAPRQVQAIASFRTALREGTVSAIMRFKLRDRRFDPTVRKIARGIRPTAKQVNAMVAAYERRSRAHNAAVHARTAANDALRRGKHLSTRAAIDAGILPADRMLSRWSNSGDDKVRPLHVDVDGEVVRFGEPFSTGDVVPGASEWSCRCIKVDFVGSPAQLAEVDGRPVSRERSGVA